jgi:AraC-like DNA-binding protein
MNKTNIDGVAHANSDAPKISLQIQIDFADVEILGEFWNRHRLPGFHWRLYSHSLPGAGLVLKDGSKREMLPDFVYLVPPSEQIGCYVAEGSPKQTFVHFVIDGCFFKSQKEVYAVRLNDALKSVIEKLGDELKRNGTTPVSQLYANAAVSLSLAECRDILDSALTDERINSVCRLMKENPARQWSNEEFAKRFGFATNAFIRKFKEIVGIPPYKYLQSIRYSLAARLLETTDLGLGEIAERIGVNDKFHFSREFKRIHERPPSEHRKKLTASIRK